MVFDLLLVLALLYTAFKTATVRALFEAIVYFIVFGMIMALVWARLGAFDLALAEAALGSGIMGALLLDTYAFIKKQRQSR